MIQAKMIRAIPHLKLPERSLGYVKLMAEAY